MPVLPYQPLNQPPCMSKSAAKLLTRDEARRIAVNIAPPGNGFEGHPFKVSSDGAGYDRVV